MNTDLERGFNTLKRCRCAQIPRPETEVNSTILVHDKYTDFENFLVNFRQNMNKLVSTSALLTKVRKST